MTLLHFLEHKETLRHGANSEAVEVVRDIQFKVLQMVLDYVTFKMDSDSIMQPRRTVSSSKAPSCYIAKDNDILSEISVHSAGDRFSD